VLAGKHAPLIVLLLLCSGLAFVVAGWSEGSFGDEQLFWQLTE